MRNHVNQDGILEFQGLKSGKTLAIPYDFPDIESMNSPSLLSELFRFNHTLHSYAIEKNKENPILFYRRGTPETTKFLEKLYNKIETDPKFKLDLKSPFEECNEIAGDVWRASTVGINDNSAIVKLLFNINAFNLESHIHELSDRVSYVYEGEGSFFYSFDGYKNFRPEHFKQISIKKGDLLIFSRNLIHTFGTYETKMGLSCLHLPFVELSDPNQYKPTLKKFSPKDAMII